MTSEVKVEQRHCDAAAKQAPKNYQTIHDYEMDLRQAFARFERDHMPVSAVPAGWKLVPVEPTEEMVRSAAEAIGVCVSDGLSDIWECWENEARAACNAMLSAAPTPPIAGVDEGEELRAMQAKLAEAERVLEIVAQYDVGYQALVEAGHGDDVNRVASYFSGQVERRRALAHKCLASLRSKGGE